MSTFGNVLYLWRRKRRLTQESLARLAGISRPNLSVMEQDGKDLTLATLRRLAQALEISPGILADGISPFEAAGKTVSRESLARVARRLRGEALALSGEEAMLARMAESLMKRKLRLTRRYGRSLPRTGREEKDHWMRLEAEYGSKVLNNLLSRVHKGGGAKT